MSSAASEMLKDLSPGDFCLHADGAAAREKMRLANPQVVQVRNDERTDKQLLNARKHQFRGYK